MPQESPVVIVSNRLPITVSRAPDGGFEIKRSPGGLVSGLRELYGRTDTVWVGHSGIFDNEPGFADLAAKLAAERLVAVPIKKKTYQAYYNGMANNAIWPLFHYFWESTKLSLDDWRAYKEANEAFAEAVLRVTKAGDRVWVHDYQLMLLPGLLREGRRDLEIAYFHHIPFPSSELFRNLPWRVEILRGLLGADLIGFHTFDYARHFLTSITRVLGSDIQVDEVHYDGRLVKVGMFPLGVDVEAIQKSLVTPTAKETLARLTKSLGSQLVFLGIDRLDYTKGIPERLQAFQQFLREHREYVGTATLLQVCVPSRADISTYGNLRAVVERLVGQINGEFARPGYTPVQYLYRSFPLEEVVALYRLAHAAIVTPLRDGLNLVCKEYVAARDDDDGVLILSEFAGASVEMGEALLVNPLDINNVARAIYEAATMEPQERRRRMRLLRQRVTEYNNITWANSFLSAWADEAKRNVAKCQPLLGAARKNVVTAMGKAQRRLLFLDYDGTLVPIVARPELAKPSAAVLGLINHLVEDLDFEVSIVTGRPRSFCNEYFAALPINIVAEHGAFIRMRGVDVWQMQPNVEEFDKIRPDIMRTLEMYTRFVPGTHIEQKEASVVWHYRQAEPIFARSQAQSLIDALGSLLGKTPFGVYQGKKTIEIKPVVANKGHAVEYLLMTMGWRPEDSPKSLLITCGDDKTDEDMYRVFAEGNISIQVGTGNIFAKYFVENPADLQGLFADVEKAEEALGA